MEKVTYFDVEYANSKNKSICQIGIMCENYKNGEPYYPEKDIYINPEDGFDDVCIRIHGISKDKVKNEATFPQIWQDIEKYFVNSVIIGHNVASADLDALIKSLKRYNLDIPEFYYICTLDLARTYIPCYNVKDYSMSTLCKYFDIDIDSEHNAFDDACANADLFKALVETYSIDIEKHVQKYMPHETNEFENYISNPMMRKSINEFYGIVSGFSIDNQINTEEINYLKKWKKENSQYSNHQEIFDIINILDEILNDGIITIEEINKLKTSIKSYLDIITTSPITLSTQILDGILKGIILDKDISELECMNLRQWLYDNLHLSNHFPFDKVMEMLDKVLEDSKITTKESEYINSIIDSLLNPVESLRVKINSVQDKHVCLSGNFSYGQKSDVENYIIENGGIIDSALKKSTDILMIGNCECQAYSNGTYGTKVKKAIEYNNKGANIQIIKESDFFLN